ncbi:MAG: hydrogenase maturation protease [Candidatus Omnitrophota bacterium]|nr:hydrogenase maturation protease [Candidatus Omnitrophota bacterium]
MSKIAVIGIGNTLRRDDGIGIEILESLLKFYKRDEVEYLNFGIASFDLLHKMQDYEAVLLIDGIKAGLGPGELKIFELKNIKYDLKGPSGSTHELNLKDILEFSKKLKLKTKIYVAGIQVEDVSYGDGLTDKLKRSKQRALDEINEFIDVLFSSVIRKQFS